MNLVIFDMDGTLVDSGKAITSTINTTRKELDLKPNLESDFIVKIINDPTKNYIKEFYPGITPSQKLMDRFEVLFRQNYEKYATIYGGIKHLLEKLKKENIAIALASNAPSKSLEKILKKLEIFEYFDYIIGFDEENPKKPDPTMLIKIINHHSKNNKSFKTIFISDSLKDKTASSNAKIQYLHANWGFGKGLMQGVDTPNEALNSILNYFYQN
ncbi:HAD family hydrolase [Campylobacter ureolyticus]|uniref:phosphoglycolate phosphatase n=1 Tax=Campylobacter ureolyticus TaxID=827 RepID=A0A9Q4KM52_9BACT|nr:HAD family hydrolase [Campylobacter ureolyticus]MCZ6160590.1 HAD family hydrolase [Campylobacter ureolyticus]MCZ6164324.1 HAD family hydrolase [Campylobacter ureolyticus]MCZ6166103.1 HAD family hydrolase [Campylobacter ureolyticus]